MTENQTKIVFPQLTTTVFGNFSTPIYSTDNYEDRTSNISSTTFLEKTTLPFEISSALTRTSIPYKTVPTTASFETTASSSSLNYVTNQWILNGTTSSGVGKKITETLKNRISSTIPTSNTETTSRTMILKPVSDSSVTDSTISFTTKDIYSTSHTPLITTEGSLHKTSFATEFTDYESTSIRTSTEKIMIYNCNAQQCANTTLCLRNFTEVRQSGHKLIKLPGK